MKKLITLLLSTAVVLPLQVIADPDKGENGHGKGRGHAYGHDKHKHKEEYWDGNCKVERKLEKNGGYKEERKCKGPSHGYYEPAPVYVPAPPPGRHDSGVIINGTIRLP